MSPLLLSIFGFELFAWGLLPLIPALVALYFLKLRRQQVVVSSTFLWKKSIEDLRVNAPFQRLRRSLLLLLQLLVLLAIILAASKPVIRGSAAPGRDLILLIDTSASMSCAEEGGTRLELARRSAQSIADGLGAGDRMAVIAFNLRSTVLQPFTSDRTALQRAIGAAAPTSLPTDLLQALRTAGALAEGQGGAEVVLLGDGAYGGLADASPEVQRLPVRFIPQGKSRDNLGITEVDVRRGFGARKGVELFVAVENSGAVERRTTLGIWQGDRLVAAAELIVAPGKAAVQTFDAGRLLAGSDGGPALLRLEIADGGILKDDDRAFVRILPPGRLEVLVVGDANPFLDRALAVQEQVDARRLSLGQFEEQSRAGRLAEEDGAKVLIFDRKAPQGPPDRPALYLGCFPGGAGPFAAAEGAGGGTQLAKGPVIVDWDRNHPVNRFLAFADLRVEEALLFPPARGFRSLIDAGDRSIAGVATFPSEGRLPVPALVVGFDILKSNWPWLHSFPIFFGNALQWLGEASGSEARPRYRTGDILTFPILGRKIEAPVFRDPSGRERPAQADRSGILSFALTEAPGLY